MVDPLPDRRIAVVRTARHEGGAFFSDAVSASEGATWFRSWNDALPCDAQRNFAGHPRRALAGVLCALCLEDNGKAHHIAIDGKTMRASKDGEGKATSAFGVLRRLGDDSRTRGLARAKGFEIPDALKLLERLDLKGKIVTGDAIFWQKSITARTWMFILSWTIHRRIRRS